MEVMRELMARPDFIVCALDEGDVMTDEKLDMDEALSRRITTNEQAYQRGFLQKFFEEEKKETPQFRAGGDVHCEFQLEDFAKLTVKGIICDEIQTLRNPFVANLDDDWKNSTRLMVAIAQCKALVHSRPYAISPYKSEQSTNRAFYETVFGGQKINMLNTTLRSKGWSSWLPETASTMQRDAWSNWLPKMPSTWQSRVPELTVVETDRLESIERCMGIAKVAGIMYPDATFRYKMRGTVVDKLHLIANEWTEDQRLRYTKEFRELAELWQTQPYDLYHRPIDLPFVIPDPYWETRKTSDQIAREQSVSYRHNIWTSAVMMKDTSETPRFRKLLMEEIKKQPAMTPQGLENVELVQYALGRRFVITKNVYLRLVPPGAQEGDKVALIQGVDVPFILRRSGQAFELVGEAYIDGMMDGKVIDQWQRVLRELPDIVLK